VIDFPVSLLFVALGAAALWPAWAHAQDDSKVALLCRYIVPSLDGGKVRDSKLNVDFAAQTVDDKAAVISENAIAWTEPIEGGRVDFNVNRFTGLMYGTVYTSNGKPFPLSVEGKCVRAGERKF
jgi:hypothetical protein